MRSHGVRFQPSLSGHAAPGAHQRLLHGRRQGAGQRLLPQRRAAGRARSATTRRSTALELDGRPLRRRAHRAASASRRAACVLAAGGFESNREWLREAWGQNERGEWPADNFLIRGTRFNQGVLLKFMIDAGRRHRSATRRRRTAWRSTRARRCTTAASARASTACRSAWSSTATRERFYDEGEDFWPKRYAIWGRLVAQQPGQIGYSIIDAQGGRPLHAAGVSRRAGATRCRSSRAQLGLDEARFMQTLDDYNAACRAGTLRPHGARRLPHRRPGAAPRRTGRGRSTRRRSSATRCGPASPSPTSA